MLIYSFKIITIRNFMKAYLWAVQKEKWKRGRKARVHPKAFSAWISPRANHLLLVSYSNGTSGGKLWYSGRGMSWTSEQRTHPCLGPLWHWGYTHIYRVHKKWSIGRLHSDRRISRKIFKRHPFHKIIIWVCLWVNGVGKIVLIKHRKHDIFFFVLPISVSIWHL